MIATIKQARTILHGEFCYQLFITPIPAPVGREYKVFAQRACEYFEDKRTEAMHLFQPRHYVVNRFAPVEGSRIKNKKILITHGWMSRAAYMVRLTDFLTHHGYEVFVPDFPAHGEARGVRLPWTDAVAIIRDIINQFGPFEAAIGHSFGGSMLLNSVNLSGQLDEWKLNEYPQKVVLMASPTRMRSPVNSLARRLKLDGSGYQYLKQVIHSTGPIDAKRVRLQNFIKQNLDIPFLCIHGTEDNRVLASESEIFCEKYPNGELRLLDNADHVSVLMDERVDEEVLDFIRK